MFFSLFCKPSEHLIVREIIFTFIIEPSDKLVVAGLMEIKVGNKFFSKEFTLMCNQSEITTEEVKTAIETIKCAELQEESTLLTQAFGKFYNTPIGTFAISDPESHVIDEYGKPKHWRRHNEAFCYCNTRTTMQDTIRDISQNPQNIRFCN